MIAKIGSRAVCKSAASVALLAVCLATGAANATTVATFNWVSSSVTGGSGVTPTGTLQLSLPDSITTQTFTTSGSLTPAQMLGSISSLSYTYSDGLSVGLANLSSTTAPTSPSLFSSTAWYTSAPTTVTLFNGTTVNGVFLLAGFTLKGSKVFPGDTRAATFQLAEPAGTQGPPAAVGLDGNGITPFAGQGVASNDAGYWKLATLETGVPTVPVPAALPLLISGLAGFGGLLARRRRASTAV